MIKLTQTLYHHDPLITLWIINYYHKTFATYNIEVDADNQGLTLTGEESLVKKVISVISPILESYKARIIHFSNIIQKIKSYAQENLLQINDKVRLQMRKCGVKSNGLYIFAYLVSSERQLTSLGIFKHLVNRVPLTSEQILKVVCMNLLPTLESKFDCHIGIQDYGLYFNGQIRNMSLCYDIVISKMERYSIHYILSQGQNNYNERQAAKLRLEFINKNVCCIYNQLVETLFQSLPVLNQFVEKIRKTYGRFVAVICKDEDMRIVNGIVQSVNDKQIVLLDYSADKTDNSTLNDDKSPKKSFDSDQTLDPNKQMSCNIPRILFRAISKFPQFQLQINEIAASFDKKIEMTEQFHNKKSLWKISFSLCEFASNIQQQLHFFMKSIRMRKLRASFSSRVDHRDVITCVYNWVQTYPQFSDVVVDNVWLSGRQLSLDVIVSNDSLFAGVRRSLQSLISIKIGYKVPLFEIKQKY